MTAATTNLHDRRVINWSCSSLDCQWGYPLSLLLPPPFFLHTFSFLSFRRRADNQVDRYLNLWYCTGTITLPSIRRVQSFGDILRSLVMSSTTWPFCPQCGTILDPPENSDNVECSQCPFKCRYADMKVTEVVTTVSPASSLHIIVVISSFITSTHCIDWCIYPRNVERSTIQPSYLG